MPTFTINTDNYISPAAPTPPPSTLKNIIPDFTLTNNNGAHNKKSRISSSDDDNNRIRNNSATIAVGETATSGEHRQTDNKLSAVLYLRQRQIADSCRAFYIPFLTSSHPPPVDTDEWWTRALYKCTCPPHGLLAALYAHVLVSILVWATLFGTVKNDALPGGKCFALWIMLFGGLFAGWLAERARLPALLGMLLWGFVLRNVPSIDFATTLDSTANGGRAWASQLRNIALAIILLRAGLGLDHGAVKRLKWAIVLLALAPAASVVIVMTMLGHWLLSQPYLWSLLLGLVSCAVSPAVIVPLMLMLQEQRYGTQKGIPSAVIAAATICGVVAVCCFGLVLGLIFNSGSLTYNILRAPIEIMIGLLYGAIVGVILWYIPEASSGKLRSVAAVRFILLVGAGVAAVCGGKALNLAGAGILGCLLTALICRHGWTNTSRDDAAVDHHVSSALKLTWLYVFQPLLFGLIGSAVAIHRLRLETLVYIVSATILILLAHIVQFGVTFAVVSVPRFDFTVRERLFLALSWLPKATFQAAIGSVALDMVRDDAARRPPAEQQFASDILTVAVLSILITAPLGALGIALGGKHLLVRAENTPTAKTRSSRRRSVTIAPIDFVNVQPMAGSSTTIVETLSER